MATTAFSFPVDHTWQLLAWAGVTHHFFSVSPETIIYTWVALGCIFLLALVGRLSIVWYPRTTIAYLYLASIRAIMQMITQAPKSSEVRYVKFFTALLCFLLICNCLIIIPYLEEPTKDLNTTLALSLITFLYIQKEAIKAHGLIPYLNEFFKTPFAVSGIYPRLTLRSICMTAVRILGNLIVGCAMLPLEIMGKLSNIISLAFRLFGNILTGSLISSLWLSCRSGSLLWHTIGLLSGANLLITLLFGLLEGGVQAFVFVMLSVSFLSRSLQHH